MEYKESMVLTYTTFVNEAIFTITWYSFINVILPLFFMILIWACLAFLSSLSHIFPILSPIFAGGSNSHYVRDIAFSPDGKHFATVCDDK